MNMYGDRGNVLALMRRLLWRELSVELVPIGLGASPQAHLWAECDLYFMGGGQDAQQIAIQDDLLRHKKELLTEAAHQGAVFLTICGGYQLLGHFYKPHEGPELKGLSLLDAYTVAGSTRFIGNVSIQRPDGSTLVGFENHSGLTYLGQDVQALGKVLVGNGNNGQDQQEGAQQGNLYGTYLHGSLLPKNPGLTDELLTKVLQRHGLHLPPLSQPDTLELKAHEKALTFKA
jgi:lipid II isoglutaminyl synthase (glutamine-hydrolysing)